MSDRTQRAKGPVDLSGRERAKRRGLPLFPSLIFVSSLTACGASQVDELTAKQFVDEFARLCVESFPDFEAIEELAISSGYSEPADEILLHEYAVDTKWLVKNVETPSIHFGSFEYPWPNNNESPKPYESCTLTATLSDPETDLTELVDRHFGETRFQRKGEINDVGYEANLKSDAFRDAIYLMPARKVPICSEGGKCDFPYFAAHLEIANTPLQQTSR